MSFQSSGHNGGWLGFGKDNFLYISTGDSGSGNGHDPDNNAQNINSLLGKILRIDVTSDGFVSDPDKFYSIPDTNPYSGSTDGADEVWSFGLRNPWRASFDRETGDLFIADVGQDSREEINRQLATSMGGENYGWRLREGSIATPTTPPDGTIVGGPQPADGVDPIYEYLR